MEAAVPCNSGEGELSLGCSCEVIPLGFGACIDSDSPLFWGGSMSAVESGALTGGGLGFLGSRLDRASIAPTGFAGKEGWRGRFDCLRGDFLAVVSFSAVAVVATGAAEPTEGTGAFVPASLFFLFFTAAD